MNRWIGMGRLTADPKINTANGKDGELKIARYTLAVDRKGKDAGADFVSCVAFGKSADFAERFLKKGTKIAVEGRIQTGSYEKQDGTKVYTTDVVVDVHEFCEKAGDKPAPANNDFMSVNGDEDGLPFN